MNRRCRRGQHALRPYKTTRTEHYEFVYLECVRCGIRKAKRTRTSA